jgi:hypothetical protein
MGIRRHPGRFGQVELSGGRISDKPISEPESGLVPSDAMTSAHATRVKERRRLLAEDMSRGARALLGIRSTICWIDGVALKRKPMKMEMSVRIVKSVKGRDSRGVEMGERFEKERRWVAAVWVCRIAGPRPGMNRS